MAVTKLDRAKAAVVLDHPFFASILMKRKLIADETIPTAAVDQRGQMYYNPNFVESLTVPELVFLLCHEVGHVIGQHAARRGARAAKRWNIAGDAWINDMLRASNVGQFIEGGVNMPGSKDSTVDEIYSKLPEDNDGSGKVPGIGDDLIERGSPITSDEADKQDSDMRVEIAQAAQAARAQGKLSGALEKIVAELIESSTPWYDILERYMVGLTSGEYSWARPNRRFAQHAYLPSTGKVAKMGNVVIQVDVSGSVSKQEIDHYNGHMQRIVELCHPESVHILYTDTQVRKHEVFAEGDEISIEFYSGGGTDMEAGFEFLAKEGIEPDVFVCLTDGYTSWNADNAPSYPVVWCISTDQEAPYGDNVHFSLHAE